MQEICDHVSVVLFPRSRKIYIFGAWLGEQFADNPKYLFLEAQEHKEIRPVWITKNESVCRKVRELGYEAYMFDSFKGFYAASGQICGSLQWDQ